MDQKAEDVSGLAYVFITVLAISECISGLGNKGFDTDRHWHKL